MFSWAEVNTETPLHELIQMMPNTCWGPADLAGTVQYVRGCRDGMVMMSDQLKTIFPESMGDWCDPLETRMMDWGAGQKWCYIIPCTMLSVFKKSRFFRGALTRPKGALTQPKGAFTRPVILGEKICNLNFMLEISKTDHVSKGPAPFWLPWDLWYLATWSYMAKPLLHVCNYLLVPFGSWKQVCLFQFCEHLLPLPLGPDLSSSSSKPSRVKCSSTLLWWFPFWAKRGLVHLWWKRIVVFSNITNSFNRKASMKRRWRNNWKTPIWSWSTLLNLYCLQSLPNWS